MSDVKTLTAHQIDLFWAKVDIRGVTECWPWRAFCHLGYGRYSTIDRDRKTTCFRAHRVAYELLIGPIPKGLTLDHLCRHRNCCNPAHLEPVTAGTNSLRGFGPPAENARRDKCIRGHVLDVRYGARQTRACRTCWREIKRAQRAAGTAR